MHSFYEIIVFSRHRVSARIAGTVVFLLVLQMPFGEQALGSQIVDSATGAEQTFTTGYAERSYAENYHREETYGPAPIAPLEEDKDRWRLHKGLKFSAAYDSNVFSARTDPKDDQIYNYVPYVGVSRQGNYHYIESFYYLSYFDYVENSKLSNVVHLHTLKVEYKKNKWRWVLTNQYKPQVSTAAGERTELSSGSSGRATTESDQAQIEAEYAVTPKTKLSLLYDYHLMNFPKKGNSLSAIQFSEQRNAITPKISYSWTPKTTLYASYRLEGAFTKDGQFSYRTYLPLAGATLRLTPKMSLDTSAGWKTRDFLEHTLPTVDGLIYKASLSRKLTTKITSTFSFVKDFNTDYVTTGAQSSKIDSTFYGLNMSYAFSHSMSLNAGAGYTLTHQGGLITKKDIENSTLTFTREQEDQQFQWDLDLRWTPAPDKNLSLGYESTKRNSSFKDSEYDDKKVVGAAEFVF